jgi:prepilin peptidase CpaA
MASRRSARRAKTRKNVDRTGMIATVCMFVFLLIAVATDLVKGKIYNKTTYPGTIIALALSATADWFENPVFAAHGLAQSLLGLLACGLIMLVCYVFFGEFGGDVKLIAMLGAFLGPERGLEALLWTFVLGAALGVILLIWRVGLGQLISRVLQQVRWSLQRTGWTGFSADEQKQLQREIYMAPSALVAVLIVRFSLVDRLLEVSPWIAPQ